MKIISLMAKLPLLLLLPVIAVGVVAASSVSNHGTFTDQPVSSTQSYFAPVVNPATQKRDIEILIADRAIAQDAFKPANERENSVESYNSIAPQLAPAVLKASGLPVGIR